MIEFTQTPAQSYAAAMDSVNLINAGKPASMTAEDWADTLVRNKEHLALQVEKADYYAGFDMAPLQAAII